MTFPRVTAAAAVILLIGVLALASFGIVNVAGSVLRHGTTVEHDAGVIKKIYPNLEFDFQEASGHIMHFTCSDHCRPVLLHMQRHLLIGAHTDVYYIRDANNILLAMDVD